MDAYCTCRNPLTGQTESGALVCRLCQQPIRYESVAIEKQRRAFLENKRQAAQYVETMAAIQEADRIVRG